MSVATANAATKVFSFGSWNWGCRYVFVRVGRHVVHAAKVLAAPEQINKGTCSRRQNNAATCRGAQPTPQRLGARRPAVALRGAGLGKSRTRARARKKNAGGLVAIQGAGATAERCLTHDPSWTAVAKRRHRFRPHQTQATQPRLSPARKQRCAPVSVAPRRGKPLPAALDRRGYGNV